MTLMQEAYVLMQRQPESNLKILVDLMKRMSLESTSKREAVAASSFKRTGVARGTLELPADFDEHFDDLNDEIAAMFIGETV